MVLSEQDWLIGQLAIGGLLLLVGFWLVLTRRNALMVFLGIELMLNAANVNFITFSKYHDKTSGHSMVMFVMMVAAAEAAVGLALLLTVWKNTKTTQLDQLG